MTAVPACFYGKLPIHAEFIRYNRGVPELEQLDRWFQEGMHRARRRFGRTFEARVDAVRPSRLLYSSPETGGLLAGVCGFSSDRAGRRYPFVIGTRAHERPTGRAFDCLPLSLDQFMYEAERLAARDWSGVPLEGFREQLSGVAWQRQDRHSVVEFTRYLESELLDHLGKPTSAGEVRLRTLEGIRRCLRPPYPSRRVIRLQCETAPGSVAFWISVVRALAPRAVPPTLIMWNSGETAGRFVLRLVMGRLSTEHFGPVFWPGLESEFARDLPGEGPVSSRPNGFSQSAFGGAAMPASGAMSAILDAIAGVR